MAALHFNQDNFETEVLKSSQPVLVDFWATWCGPCRMITPFVEQLADEFAGQAKVGKVDVDENPDLAAKYGVNGVPTLLVIKDGKVVDKTVGAAPKARLADMLKRAL
jgi:thioredoxin 1